MPLTIPYDPSLSLMSVVSETTLQKIRDIAQVLGPVEAAQDAQNALISSRRSLLMTKNELENLGISVDPLDKEMARLDKTVEDAAAVYMAAKVRSEVQVTELKAQARKEHKPLESPMDYMRSKIKTMPLSADTMNIDVEYFSFDSASQDSAVYSSQIAAFVTQSASSVLGQSVPQQLGTAASRQTRNQLSINNLQGTLVVSVTCAHKNASVVAPFVLQVDKAIKAWNQIFPSNKMDPTNKSSMTKTAMIDSQEDGKKFSIISGVTFGSSFIGLIHVLRSSDSATADLTTAVQKIQAAMDTGAWLSNAEKRERIQDQFFRNVKSIIDQQNVQSHATVLAMGASPSAVAIERGDDHQPDAKDALGGFTPMELGTLDELGTARLATETARLTKPIEMEKGIQQGDLGAVKMIDGEKGNGLDIASMMAILDDHLKKIGGENYGVPINYYLKDIDQKMLAEMWLAKYHPGEGVTIMHDDTEDNERVTSE